jgi:class 3 adenylate cyclase
VSTPLGGCVDKTSIMARAMTQLRTAVLMKTDIAGSTPAFRALLTTDHQALLHQHGEFIGGLAAENGGRILESAGDGYWLEFPSVTGAAKSAVAMQEALRSSQADKGDDRLSIRIVIGLGDIVRLDDAMLGDVVPLIVRIETITPADEIYLTSAAHSALAPAEIQTALVDSFPLKGFNQPVAVYRVEQRHRTRIIANAYILYADLCGFGRLVETVPVATVERVLDDLGSLTSGLAHEFGGTIRSNRGDSYWITYSEAPQIMAMAERLSLGWDALGYWKDLKCPINIVVHRGRICTYRSFQYGEGYQLTWRIQQASRFLVMGGESGVFVTSTVRDGLCDSPWYGRLDPVVITQQEIKLDTYRLADASAIVAM